MEHSTHLQSHAGAAICARDVVRRFGSVVALDHVSLAVERGEFFSLLGPSGCGKTTFLRIVAGLDHPDSGDLRIGGENALPLPPHRRPVNTVFQSYALFPHLCVRDNVAFGLRMKKAPGADIARRVALALDQAQIADLSDRWPRQLSGGQKQRVALARALVNEPEVLLLDEPLAALDVTLRRQLQGELRSIQRRLGITFVLVTHDQDEAISLSDRIAVMNTGRVIQFGTASQMYEQPRTRFVAQFVGGCNLIPGTVSNPDIQRVKTSFGELFVPAGVAGATVTLAIRPEKIVCGGSPASINQFEATILGTTYTGPETHLQLELAGQRLNAVVLNASARPAFHAGERLGIYLPPESILVLDD